MQLLTFLALVVASASAQSFCETVDLTTQNSVAAGVQLVAGTNSQGSAEIFYDELNQRIWWQISVTNLAAGNDVTAAHFHLGGPQDQGPVQISLLVAGAVLPGPSVVFSGRVNIQDPDMLANLLSGNWYVNVHTTNNAQGEVRGQILAAEKPVFITTTLLDTDQSIAAGVQLVGNVANAQGRTELIYDPSSQRLCWGLAYSGLSSNTTIAHFHLGAAGLTGRVAATISDVQFDDPHVGSTTLSLADFQNLVNEQWYINVHTQQNSDGEIRGQVTGFQLQDPDRNIIAPGAADTGSFCESVPLTTQAVTLGSPVGRVPVNADNSAGIASIQYDGITNTVYWTINTVTSSPITLAHFHVGDANSEGGVDVTIAGPNVPDEVDGPTDTFLSPLEGSQVLSRNEYANLLAGQWYINIHTETNPAGELRGQILANEEPVMRSQMTLTTEAELFGLQGTAQLVGINDNTGGAAVVLYSQRTRQLCWAVSFNSLSSPTTQAHFHGPALPSETNGVQEFIFNGTVSSPNVGSTILEPAQEADLLNNMWYINVHTTSNPTTGEIRGQVDNFAAITPQAVTPVVDVQGLGASSIVAPLTSTLVTVAAALSYAQMC